MGVAGCALNSACKLTLPNGEKIRLDETAPRTTMAKVQGHMAERNFMIWNNRQPDNLPDVPWVLPVSRVIKRKASKLWTVEHSAALRIAVLGGYPSQKAAHARGHASSPICPLCGKKGGTLQHLYFECEGQWVKEIRVALGDPFAEKHFRSILPARSVGHGSGRL